MMNQRPWPPRLAQEARLRALDALISANDSDAANIIAPQVERAGLLNALGRPDDARAAYLDILTRTPDHFGVLTDFGALLVATGFRAAARTVYARAVAQHPTNPKGHVNLANLLLGDGEVAAARQHFETALEIEHDHPQAHQGLGTVLATLGDRDGAAWHRGRGYAQNAVTTLPYRGAAPPLAVLLLVSADGGDIPTAPFLDDRIFATTVAVADYVDPTAPLPPHDLVFNAIGDADLCDTALDAAAALVARTTAPVVNHPAAVRATGRLANAHRLGALAGVVTPRMILLRRAALADTHAAAPDSLAFPLLLRSPGFHTGRHFVPGTTPPTSFPRRRVRCRATSCWRLNISTRVAPVVTPANTGS